MFFALIAPPDAAATSAWLAFLTPICLALLAIVQLITARLAAHKADKVAVVAAEVAATSNTKTEQLVEVTKEAVRKTDGLVEKTAEIHGMTNSNLSRISAELQVANEKITGLKAMLSVQQQTIEKHTLDEATKKAADGATLAAAAAAPPITPAPAPVTPAAEATPGNAAVDAAVHEKLDSIDKTGLDTNSNVHDIREQIAHDKELQIPLMKAVIEDEKRHDK